MLPGKMWRLILMIGAFLFSSFSVALSDIAIIVNKENPEEGLSFNELVKIFTQDKRQWSDGTQIFLIMRETGSPEKAIVLHKIYRMKRGEDLKRFWLEKIFREEISSLPYIVSSDEAVIQFVSEARNAIGFIDMTYLDERVKSLPIDGKRPGENTYPLSVNLSESSRPN